MLRTRFCQETIVHFVDSVVLLLLWQWWYLLMRLRSIVVNRRCGIGVCGSKIFIRSGIRIGGEQEILDKLLLAAAICHDTNSRQWKCTVVFGINPCICRE